MAVSSDIPSPRMDGPTSRYFVAKAINMEALRGCHETRIWGCRGRKASKQPKDFLSQAFEGGPVILIFSVNNCHGWHGYARMLSKPMCADSNGSQNMACADGVCRSVDVCLGNVTVQNDGTQVESSTIIPKHNSDKVSSILTKELQLCKTETHSYSLDSKQTTQGNLYQNEVQWFRFKVAWLRIYLGEHGEQCLPFCQTENLQTADGTTLNKSRNFQELSENTGRQVCHLLDNHYQGLSDAAQQKRDAKVSAPLFQPKRDEDPHVLWRHLLQKVETMGMVLLACAFGSQR